MKRNRLLASLALALGLSSPAAWAQHDHPVSAAAGTLPRLGSVDFPNSGSPVAQEAFLRGVALLHSYEYDDARAAFREARATDPDFAMAYWLEAFAHSQFDWGIEDLAAARDVLARLAPDAGQRLAMAPTGAERRLGQAIEAFLRDGQPQQRVQAFAAATRAWADDAPTDVEAAAFAARGALYLLASAPAGEREHRAEDAIAQARRVVALRPAHPGGVHYLIHATDSPRHAAQGLEAARIYDRIAPDAEHALHMPSHIYLQLGMWDGVVAANERAWAASRSRVERSGAGADALGWHSLEWLQYGYLQQGRYADAWDVVETARSLLEADAGDGDAAYPDARYTLERLAFQFAVETGQWQRYPAFDAGALADGVAASGSPRERGMAALAAYHAALATLALRQDQDTVAVLLQALRDAAGTRPANAPGDRLSAVLDNSIGQLAAYQDWVAGRQGAAIDALAAREASERGSGAATAPVGPPNALPRNELLATWLLAEGRPAEAIKAWEQALRDRPNRSAAWLGLARARAAAGEHAQAAAAYARLLENWTAADAGLPALAEARAGAAARVGD